MCASAYQFAGLTAQHRFAHRPAELHAPGTGRLTFWMSTCNLKATKRSREVGM